MNRNPQIELAERYVMETGVSIFLTGKAGTGKTTFLHHIVEHSTKRHVVLAPTGVAAVNAGGVTIHSFFQLPFCPYLPDVKELVTEYQMPDQKKQLRKSKVDIIRTLDLLIIDEISMVRADLLDAVDATLRRYRRSSKPFGGVQLLLIGDVQQLAPVVTDDERPYMERVYPSPFFFHSKALQRVSYVTIQLTTIYRQQDPTFVGLLNNIRDNRFDQSTLDALNARVLPATDEKESGQQDPILLTTHNYQADRVNKQRLEALATEPFTLQATVEGNFPEANFPTDRSLVLKPGAQVMFVKNDGSGAHRYFNGKIGTVDELAVATNDNGDDEQVVYVIDEEGEKISVAPERWENIKYEIDPADNQIKQIVDGTFVQYPLKTAWAITIHKAQGLTFDKVKVDASAAFTYGQVYVALSRCRSLEGLILLSPITSRNSFGSSDIEQFNSTITPPEVAAQNLDAYRLQYYYDVLFELFDFSAIQHDVESVERLFQDHLRSTYQQYALMLGALVGGEVAGMMDVAERFRHQLGSIGQMPPAESEPLLAERIGKATGYFLDQVGIVAGKVMPVLNVDVDNKEVASRLKDIADRFTKSVGLKLALLKKAQKDGFDIESYQKTKVDFTLEKPKKSAKKSEVEYTEVKYPKLVPMLTSWRKTKAEDLGIAAYMVLHQKTVMAIANVLPRNKTELLKVAGMGKAKVNLYGAEILQIISDFCEDNRMEKIPSMVYDEQPKPEKKKDAEPAWQRAAALFAEGKTIQEVASEMLRAVSTVEGYILTAVEKGAMDPEMVLPSAAQEEIVEYLLENPGLTTLKEVYEHFEGRYSYMQLRVGRYLKSTLD